MTFFKKSITFQDGKEDVFILVVVFSVGSNGHVIWVTPKLMQHPLPFLAHPPTMVDFFVFISEILCTIQNDNPSDCPTAIKMATCELSKPNNCHLQCHRFFGSQSVFCSTNATRCMQCKVWLVTHRSTSFLFQ
uniref:Uncharacterized protein n=1 Tax=Micrurus corallinus TaxID=54390 RepID=A0A2D4GR55_MICCO